MLIPVALTHFPLKFWFKVCNKCKGVKEANMPLYCRCAGDFNLTFSAKVSALIHLPISMLKAYKVYLYFFFYRASLSRSWCFGTSHPTITWDFWRRPSTGCLRWALRWTRALTESSFKSRDVFIRHRQAGGQMFIFYIYNFIMSMNNKYNCWNVVTVALYGKGPHSPETFSVWSI